MNDRSPTHNPEWEGTTLLKAGKGPIGLRTNDPDASDGTVDAQGLTDSEWIEDTAPAATPERSRLYSLPPAGIGSGVVESMTSYLCRLASAHTVSTWALLRAEIGPRLFEPGAVLRSRLGELVATTGAALNGDGATSRTLVSMLTTLTGRNDLDHLTMGFCRGFVSSRFLVRVEQTWCPACLAEWRTQDRLIYWPLLWQILAVRVCPRHCIPLETTCGACGHTFYPLSAHSRPGWCSNCGEWLGASDSNQTPSMPGLEVEQEIATRICDFLQTGHSPLTTRGSSAFPRNIELLRNSHFGGNVAALSRFLRVNRYTILGWERRTQSPRLLLLADLSRKVKVSPEALLSQDLQSTDFSIGSDAPSHLVRRRTVASPVLDSDHARRVLEEVVGDDESAPPSLSKVAARLRCRTTTLQRRFPDLVRRIKDRYREACQNRQEARAKHIKSIVRKTTLEIHHAGEYPSQHRVRESLGGTIDMRDPAALQEWKQTLVDLGFGHDPEPGIPPNQGG